MVRAGVCGGWGLCLLEGVDYVRPGSDEGFCKEKGTKVSGTCLLACTALPLT